MRAGSTAIAGIGTTSSSDLYVALLDGAGLIVQVSPPPASSCGWADDGRQWIGRHLYEVFVPYGAARPETAMGLDPVIASGSYTAAGMLRCGVTAFSVRTVALPEGTEPRAHHVAYLRPLWAPKAKENHAMQQTMPADQVDYAIHRVTGGLAHDINNALFVVIGLAEEMLENVEEGAGVSGDTLRTILNKARLIGTKSHQILRLMEVPRPTATVQPLQPVLERLVSEMAGSCPETVQLRTHFDAPEALAQFHAEDLEQILRHCLENAAASMPAGGLIEIGLSCPGDGDSGQLQIWVSDSGCGMSEAVLAQCQDVYYSTWGKPGLGLAIVKALARGMRTVLVIQSTPESGTRVQLEIPRHASTDDGLPTH